MTALPLYNEPHILQLVTTGDEQAFEQLFRHYRNKAYSIALTYMSSPDLAEDVLQEFFLKLWKQKETLVHIERFEQYFFVMLRNMLISALRQADRQQKIKGYIRQSDMLQPTPHQLAEACDLQQIIRHTLDTLPIKQQMIYRMSREEGLSHDEIGTALQLSPRTISNIISIVLNHLRDTLKAKGYLPETIIAAILFFC